MKITTTILAGLLPATLTLPATAQNAYEYRNQPTNTNHARTRTNTLVEGRERRAMLGCTSIFDSARILVH